MAQLGNVEYWREVIHHLELAAKYETEQEFIKNLDYSNTIPEALRDRVARILPYDFYEFDRNAYIDMPSVEISKSGSSGESTAAALEREKREQKAQKEFNESTCSEVERLENEFPKFELRLDIPMTEQRKTRREVNWFTSYICKNRKDRVIWDSKIYQMDNSKWPKTLDEQAEELMDASSERFVEWINSLGSTKNKLFTKEKLKALFTIEGDRRLLASIETDPKEVKAIAKTVADKWNLPQMAIELKYEKYTQQRLMNVPTNVIKVAFGRTVPYKDRPWVPTKSDKVIATIFPEELLSGQKLFKGLDHLRSTKKLIDFYNDHPTLPKPEYLVHHGMFKKKQKATTKQDIPLYELLKLKY